MAVAFNPLNGLGFLAVIAKVLSFASYELPRFIGPHNPERVAWLLSDLRLTPFALLAVGVGFLQPLLMVVMGFRKGESDPAWSRMRWLMAATLLLTGVAFLFTSREPWALTFYVTFPVAFLYSLHCYGFFMKGERWLAFAALILVAGFVTNTALAVRNLSTRSLYLNRSLPQLAIAQRDYRILGERRPGTLY
jgi:hypothetical protein